MKSRKRRKSGGYEPITDEFLKSLSPTQYWWTCFKCYGEWGNGLGFTRIANDEDDSVYDFTKTGHEILKYEDYEFDICRMYGLCPKCNSSRLIIGFNNLSRYAGTKYSPLQWLHATKNKDINLNFINTSTFSIYETKLWWSCPAQHEWENSFMRECHRYAAHYCYYENCRLPLNKREHDIIDGLNLHSIFSEWDKERNPSLITYSGEMDYSAFSTYSFTTYWWKCSKNDKHVWQDTLWQRMKNPTCSECFPSGESLVEIDFYDELKKHIPDLTRKHWVEGLYWSSGHGKNKMVADMVSVNHRVAIEYDGYAYHSGIRTKSEYEVHEKRDMEKTEAFIKTGWKVVRIREGELKFLQAREGLHQVNHHFVNNRFSSQYDNSVKKTVNEILTIKDLIY